MAGAGPGNGFKLPPGMKLPPQLAAMMKQAGGLPPGMMPGGPAAGGGAAGVPPGGMPPGGMPPGMMPPGGMPPGAMPPGAMPPGMMPPGGQPTKIGMFMDRLAEHKETVDKFKAEGGGRLQLPMPDDSRWVSLYPCYIDCTRKVSQGRRLPLARLHGCEKPNVSDLRDALKQLGIPCTIDIRKRHPRTGFGSVGRAKVLLSEGGVFFNEEVQTRKQLWEAVAKLVPSMEDRKKRMEEMARRQREAVAAARKAQGLPEPAAATAAPAKGGKSGKKGKGGKKKGGKGGKRKGKK